MPAPAHSNIAAARLSRAEFASASNIAATAAVEVVAGGQPKKRIQLMPIGEIVLRELRGQGITGTAYYERGQDVLESRANVG